MSRAPTGIVAGSRRAGFRASKQRAESSMDLESATVRCNRRPSSNAGRPWAVCADLRRGIGGTATQRTLPRTKYQPFRPGWREWLRVGFQSSLAAGRREGSAVTPAPAGPVIRQGRLRTCQAGRNGIARDVAGGRPGWRGAVVAPEPADPPVPGETGAWRAVSPDRRARAVKGLRCGESGSQTPAVCQSGPRPCPSPRVRSVSVSRAGSCSGVRRLALRSF